MGKTEPAERTIVYLGNRNAIELLDDPDDLDAAAAEERAPAKLRRAVDGPAKNCTTVVLAPDTGLMDAAYAITHANQGVWQAHSDDPGPAWVASTDPALAQLLAAHYKCEVRDPEPAGTDTDGEG